MVVPGARIVVCRRRILSVEQDTFPKYSNRPGLANRLHPFNFPRMQHGHRKSSNSCMQAPCPDRWPSYLLFQVFWMVGTWKCVIHIFRATFKKCPVHLVHIKKTGTRKTKFGQNVCDELENVFCTFFSVPKKSSAAKYIFIFSIR